MIDEKKLKKELAELSLKCPYSVLDERFALYTECFEKAICLLKEQPKVGEWIPVEERFPEDNQAVLTCKNKQISILIWKSERRIWLEPKGNWWWSYCMVEKWLPLPELYSSED